MHQKLFGGRAQPGPSLPRPHNWIEGCPPPRRGEENGERKKGEEEGNGKGRDEKGRGGKAFTLVKIKSWVRPCMTGEIGTGGGGADKQTLAVSIESTDR